jgi:hypothetical protein
MHITRTLKIAAVLLAVMVLSMAVYGFAAANTVPASKAGDGEGAVTGYTVSAVKYNLNTTNPSLIDSVTLTMTTAPTANSTIRIQLLTGGSWYTCPYTTASTTVVCDNGSSLGATATVLSVTNLRVVIAD